LKGLSNFFLKPSFFSPSELLSLLSKRGLSDLLDELLLPNDLLESELFLSDLKEGFLPEERDLLKRLSDLGIRQR
jgi:hypothetical protein